MEKLIYTLQGLQPNADAHLLPALKQAGGRNITLNIADDRVAAGKHLQITSSAPLPDAVVSFWLNSAFHRSHCEQAIANHCERFHGYAVSESMPLNAPPPHAGFTQIAFLKRPDHVPRTDWIRIWLEDHTQVAMDTQSTHFYAQNIVTRAVTGGAEHWDAIIEERFPLAALADQHCFFAADDDAQLLAHKKAMFKSCGRFMDFNKINVLITSTHHSHNT